MWGFPKKRKPPKVPTPPWLKWLVIGFIAWSFFQNMHQNSPVHQAVMKAENNLDPKKIVQWQDYKNKLFPHEGLRSSDIEQGNGPAAICGQTAEIAYHPVMGEAAASPATKDEHVSFRIGGGKVSLAIAQGVIGMRAGGKRLLIVPAEMMSEKPAGVAEDAAQGASIELEVTLLKLSPPLPGPQEAPLRIASIRSGGESSIGCGKPAKIQMTLWSIDGKKLFSTLDEGHEPLTITPGSDTLFMGLEQGIIGMGRRDMRTLIVPPAYQKTLDGSAPAEDFPFPKNQTVLADVEALP